MFRNNPFFNKSEDSFYTAKLVAIADILEARIIQYEKVKKERKIAAELAARLERERIDRETKARLAEMRNQFQEYLKLSFRLWYRSLNRRSERVKLDEIVF